MKIFVHDFFSFANAEIAKNAISSIFKERVKEFSLYILYIHSKIINYRMLREYSNTRYFQSFNTYSICMSSMVFGANYY